METSALRRTTVIILALAAFFIMAIPTFADTVVLEKGDQSSEIAEVQAALKKLGYFNADCTGYFGDITEAAVLKFQEKYGLDADGVIGPATIDCLNKQAGGNITLPSRSSSARKDTTKVNVRYKIKKGDTIWDIAADYNVSVDSILKYNGLDEKSILDIGKEIIIPNVVKVVKPSQTKPAETKTEAAAPSGNSQAASGTKAENPTQDSSELANIYEYNNDVYVVKDGDSVESIAEDFGVTADAIRNENNLNIDAALQTGQEIKIPEGNDADTEVDSNEESDVTDTGVEYLDWFKEVQYIYEKGDIATVTDVDTGKSFKVKRLYGRNHADSEPLTKEDTKIMKSIYNGSWSWDRRAIIVTVYDKEKKVERKIAASMNGMPHGGESITDNNFKGQFCIHFKNSRTHSGNRWDAAHQDAVKKAAGL